MRIFYLIKKEFIEIFRQKELLPLIFIASIIQIIILGYVVKIDIKNIPIEIINLTTNKNAARIINRINNTPLFQVKAISDRSKDTVNLLKRGQVKAVIIFKDPPRQNPFNYPEIQVSLDGIDSNTSLIAAGYLNGIIKKFLLDNLDKAGNGLPAVSKTLIRFNPTLDSINYMGPGIVAVLLTIISLFFTSISIVREKQQQTFDTLLISTITSTQQQALFFAWFTMLTFILLSGLFTPIENIPPGLRILADINPIRYLIKIIREIFLKGNGIEYFYQELLYLLAIASVTITVSVINFKRFISK